MPSKKATPILRELGDGLVMRRTTAADAARVADFNFHIHLEDDTGNPDPGIPPWTRDLFSPNHPTFHPDDFVIVEDRNNDNKIVSATCLIDQTWTYDGIPFPVGRPELVGTLPEYRRRGLVREIFQEIHALSAARSQMMQVITGIPWYYRQFGYEMCLTLDGGRFASVPQSIPQLKKGEHEPYRVRPATEKDVKRITRWADDAARRYLVNVVRGEAEWRYELNGRRSASVQQMELRVIETPEGKPIGFLAHTPRIYFDGIAVAFYEVAPGVAWPAVNPSVLRYLKTTGDKYARRQDKKFSSIFFMLGSEHPIFETAGPVLPREQPPYAWYIRIPDIPAFVKLIAPALERRLAATLFAGISGEYRLNFFKSGMRMVFEKGCIKAAEPWQPEKVTDGEAGFPGLTFLQVLLGHRTINDIRYIYPDQWCNKWETRVFFNALFSKQASRPWGIS